MTGAIRTCAWVHATRIYGPHRMQVVFLPLTSATTVSMRPWLSMRDRRAAHALWPALLASTSSAVPSPLRTFV